MFAIGSLFAEVLPAQPTASQMLGFLAGGLCVVVLALGFLAVCSSAVAVALRWGSRRKESFVRKTVEHEATEEISEELMVVIAAAVASVITEPHHIVRVRESKSAETNWTLVGRMRHHASHHLRS